MPLDPWEVLRHAVDSMKSDINSIIEKIQAQEIKTALLEERQKNIETQKRSSKEYFFWIVPTLIALLSLVLHFYAEAAK